MMVMTMTDGMMTIILHNHIVYCARMLLAGDDERRLGSQEFDHDGDEMEMEMMMSIMMGPKKISLATR